MPLLAAAIGFLALLAALLLSTPAADARSLSDGEKAKLAETVKDFTSAMTGSRFERIVATVPPKIMDHIAKGAGIPKEQIIAAMIAGMRQGFGDIKIEEFSMDFAAATFKESKDGKPYALIPTRTIITAPNQRIDQKSQTLGLLDDGQWYLVRISEAQQITILREVYPEFAGIEFPRE